jgi:hypothetical protein
MLTVLVWSLPLYSIGMIDSTAEDDGFSRELEFSPELYEGPDLLAIVAGTSALQSAALPTTVSPSRNSQAPVTSTDSPSDLSQLEISSSHKFIRNRPPVASTETLSHPPRSWGKKSKRQSATIRDPLIQTQVSPLAGGGARAYQPVKPQKVLPVATVPQTAKTQESTVRHPSRRAETNTAPRGSQGLADSYVKDSIGKAKWRAGAAPDSKITVLLLVHILTMMQAISGCRITLIGSKRCMHTLL